ncbi:serine protease [Sporichthya polymorpha]|uniref:serine protease n=1 Tax=Sporichthya polymorpha TaxID=35751 RepID=UPI0003A1FF76|nr:serine protease [Sporichthya polymorpha]
MSSSPFKRVAMSALATAVAATAAVAVQSPGASAESVPTWPAADVSMIHPGIQTVTDESSSCTSNFVFTDKVGNAYLGQAAHCSGTGTPDETDGCQSESLPLGTPVKLGESGVSGKMVYNSWLAMQKAKETDANACAFNDFALIQIPKSAIGQVNPSIPVFGGPVGVRTEPMGSGEAVFSYGNSPLRGGLTQLSPKQGFILGEEGGGWTHTIFTATPGVPGDSGSGFLDSEGRAFGILSTLALLPFPASNGVTDLAKALAYAEQHSNIRGLRLATGTEGFAPGALPALAGITGKL